MNLPIEKYIIAINIENCTGCRLCELVCSLQNSGEINPSKSSIRLIAAEEKGINRAVPVLCLQCEDPTCEKVCPAEAIKLTGNPLVMRVEEEKCLGCQICVYACPINALTMDIRAGKVLRCNQCEGEPLCVKICPFGALNYIRSDKADVQLKRSGLRSLLNLKSRLT